MSERSFGFEGCSNQLLKNLNVIIVKPFTISVNQICCVYENKHILILILIDSQDRYMKQAKIIPLHKLVDRN